MGRSFPKSLCKAPDSQEDSYLQGVYSLSPPHRALSKVRDTVLADGQREALSLSLCGVRWVSVLWILHLFPHFMASIPFHPKGVCGKGLDSSLEAAPSLLPAEEGRQCCPQRHSFRVHVTVHGSISSTGAEGPSSTWMRPRRAIAWTAASPPASFHPTPPGLFPSKCVYFTGSA